MSDGLRVTPYPRGGHVSLVHTRHLVSSRVPQMRIRSTACGLEFIPGGSPRDWGIHEPVRRDCPRCYPA